MACSTYLTVINDVYMYRCVVKVRVIRCVCVSVWSWYSGVCWLRLVCVGILCWRALSFVSLSLYVLVCTSVCRVIVYVF